MNSNKLITPEGTKDYLFEEAVLRTKVENNLNEVFKFRGYTEVVTPSIEFLDVFNGSTTGVAIEKMYKMTDSKGRLIVMRPDSTMPIARLCNTRLQNQILPLRLYYNQPIFTVTPSLKGRSDEKMQTGIELVGASEEYADLEVLVTAVKALQSLGFKQYRLEIGHIGIFSSLVDSLDVESVAKEQIRQLIEEKNYPALNDLLDGLKNQEIASVIKQLPRLFGDETAIETAKKYIQDTATLTVLNKLEVLYKEIQKLSTKDKITVDLGIVNRTDYYTGIVFKGYVEGYGSEVLSGGRYDSLYSEFGMDRNAIGFAIDVDAVVDALIKLETPKINKPAVLVYANDGYKIKALEYIDKLATLRIVSEYSLTSSYEKTLKYAREKGIERIDIIGEEVTTVMV